MNSIITTLIIIIAIVVIIIVTTSRFEERNVTFFPVGRAGLLVFEPCNYASNIAYYQAMMTMMVMMTVTVMSEMMKMKKTAEWIFSFSYQMVVGLASPRHRWTLKEEEVRILSQLDLQRLRFLRNLNSFFLRWRHWVLKERHPRLPPLLSLLFYFFSKGEGIGSSLCSFGTGICILAWESYKVILSYYCIILAMWSYCFLVLLYYRGSHTRWSLIPAFVCNNKVITSMYFQSS